MIVQVFDNGWGNLFAAKQFEVSLVDQLLAPLASDDHKTVVINSVWYSQDLNDKVMRWLNANDFDHLVLVAMLDPAIPWPDRFGIFDKPVTALGYYPGRGHVDFWAMFVDRFLVCPSQCDLLDDHDIDTAFMCLNRKPHWHRQELYKRLREHQLLERGLISMGGADGVAQQLLPVDVGHTDIAPNSGPEQNGMSNDIASLGHPTNWRRCFLNIVTETVFDINRFHFVSEKIYKPIVGCRPFLVYDPDGARTWLQDRGFECYVDDFRDISDLDLSVPGNLAPFLSSLCYQPVTYLRHKFLDLKEKILHNKNQFHIHVERNHHTVQKGIQCPI
jgi:hypothetical protein